MQEKLYSAEIHKKYEYKQEEEKLANREMKTSPTIKSAKETLKKKQNWEKKNERAKEEYLKVHSRIAYSK